MNKYTIFCREASGEGTMFIQSAEAETWQEAAREVLADCSVEWGMDSDEINVIGVASGDIEIIDWDDDPQSSGVDIEG